MLTNAGVPFDSFAEPAMGGSERPNLVCFSHLRWDFVFQRPQHLMSRFANDMAVTYWEEPIVVGPDETARLELRQAEDFPAVMVAVPHLPAGLTMAEAEAALTKLCEDFAATVRGPLIAWYYTPMMLPFSRGL